MVSGNLHGRKFRPFHTVFRYNGAWRPICAVTLRRFIDNPLRCTIASIHVAINGAELEILRMFRAYDVKEHEMLFFPTNFTKPQSRRFTGAMQSMIERGWVIKERRQGAYSLTALGYREALRLSVAEPAQGAN